MSTTGSTRVILISDNRLFLDGTRMLLLSDGRMEVVAALDHLPTREGLLNGSRADAVLLDVGISGARDFVAALDVAQRPVKVIAVGLMDSPQELLDFAESGADGYVLRGGGVDDMVEAVQCALRGELECSRQVAALLMRRVAALAAGGGDGLECAVAKTLTAREREIGELLQGGLNNKQIAARLCISVSTVKNHVHSILEKLDARSRGEAAALLRADACSSPRAGRAAPRRP